MNKSPIIILIIFLIAGWFMYKFSQTEYICHESKTFYYYVQQDLNVGMGISPSNGQMVMVATPDSTKIYIAKEDAENIPSKVFQEEKCLSGERVKKN